MTNQSQGLKNKLDPISVDGCTICFIKVYGTGMALNPVVIFVSLHYVPELCQGNEIIIKM